MSSRNSDIPCSRRLISQRQGGGGPFFSNVGRLVSDFAKDIAFKIKRTHLSYVNLRDVCVVELYDPKEFRLLRHT